jgi:hypothetical protein
MLPKREEEMTIKELLEMEIHEEYVFNHTVPHCPRIVIRVPGGWIYETENLKNGAYPGGMTSCFVPEPNLQTISSTNNGYDEWLKPLSQTFLSRGITTKHFNQKKTSSQWEDSTKTKRRIS